MGLFAGVTFTWLVRLGRLNIPSRPARRSLGEVGRDALMIGRRFSAGLEFGHLEDRDRAP